MLARLPEDGEIEMHSHIGGRGLGPPHSPMQSAPVAGWGESLTTLAPGLQTKKVFVFSTSVLAFTDSVDCDGSDNTNKHVDNASTKSREPHHQDIKESSVELEDTLTISVKEYMKKLNNELVSWSQLGAERRSNKKKAKLDLATSTLELNLANCHEFLTDDDKRSISMTVDCPDILKTYEDMKDMAAVNAHLKHKMKHRTKSLLDRVDVAIAVTKADICHKDDPD
uniref:Uncharacterized protein n=1 Tax=Timema cristinae TaxID=61476 RepID=A0A7R9GTU8_TIMCR|nr:unnamed protein product [Timema cristinae]